MPEEVGDEGRGKDRSQLAPSNAMPQESTLTEMGEIRDIR